MKIFILLFIMLLALSQSSIYSKYYQQAYTIAASMTLDQKIGQTIQLDFYGVTSKTGTTSADAIKFSLGSLLVGGNGCPDNNGNIIDFDNLKEDQVIALYANATIQKWQQLGSKFNYTININASTGKNYKIRPLLATDAVHGDQHVMGSILFPHNIGLSCTHNAQNFYNMGYWTAKSIKRYGFNYAFAPTVAVSHNPQWGRYYQTMGQQHDYIFQYGKSYTEGIQGKPGSLTGVLGSVKHFFADGATMYGADEGNSQVGSYKNFVYHNTQGYNGSINAEIGSVMASYSAVNFVPMAAGSYLNSILRKDLGFDGFVISDYNQIEKLSGQYLPTSYEIMQKNESVATMFAAGIDMFMIPSRPQMIDYITFTKMGLQNNTILLERLNDAVARILSVKLALGLVQASNPSLLSKEKEKVKQFEQVEQIPKSTNEYQDSLDAVHESLVLLKNEKVIPVQKNQIEYVVLVGEKIININNLAKNQLFMNYDNIGMQSGGWTARWQGFQGNTMWLGANKVSSNASSIVDGLKTINKNIKLVYPNYTTFTQQTKIDIQRNQYLTTLKTLRKNMTPKNTIILAVMGQTPYAQMCGDINIPYCQNNSGDGCQYFPNPYQPQKQKNTLQVKFDTFEKNVVDQIKEQDKNIPLVTILLSGRPMIINDLLNDSSAFISAFLPGTSGGQGIVDALVGDYIMRPNGTSQRVNSLSFTWPKSMDQLKEFPYYGADGQIPQIQDPLFKVGYGLSSK